MPRDWDDICPPERPPGYSRAFNKCTLCDASGDYWNPDFPPKNPSPIQYPGKMRRMICFNGHYFEPQQQFDFGMLEKLTQEYYNTLRD